ncbi:hypothetical protein FKX85_01080 [Echinicola soli]|uniref:Outer membrane protein beta-barrel domain-containing protein n=1 Tax=Echinicola soli TaxID=2591634 RepID=A0A514CD18_9BACT|nr:hypothetical protein [Echinicola soli]QDH77711.1 hypothetical protein FKX85_01080 [Echinicola soli]
MLSSMSKLRALPVLFVLFFFVGTVEVVAQREFYQEEDEKVPLSERLYFGGNLGLQFGNITYVEVSPLVGVMITDRYSAGLGITYQYLKYKNFGEASNVYGGRIFNRYNVLPNLFAHAEYENLSVEAYREDDFGRIVADREWVPGLFLGGGYFVPFGRRGGVNFTLLYNVLYDNQNLIYTEPYVIRLGFVL